MACPLGSMSSGAYEELLKELRTKFQEREQQENKEKHPGQVALDLPPDYEPNNWEDLVLNELIETEETYRFLLIKIIKEYRDPLVKDNLLVEKHREKFLNTCFGQIPGLTQISDQLLAGLKNRETSPFSTFVEVAPFALYEFTEYSLKYLKMLRKIDRMVTISDGTRDFLMSKEPLETLLLVPVQRFPRYVLLLKALSKNYESKGLMYLKDEVDQVLKIMQDVADKVNENIRLCENANRLSTLQRRMFAANKAMVVPPINVKGRWLLGQIPCIKEDASDASRSGKRHVFVFNDGLMYCRGIDDSGETTEALQTMGKYYSSMTSWMKAKAPAKIVEGAHKIKQQTLTHLPYMTAADSNWSVYLYNKGFIARSNIMKIVSSAAYVAPAKAEPGSYYQYYQSPEPPLYIDVVPNDSKKYSANGFKANNVTITIKSSQSIQSEEEYTKKSSQSDESAKESAKESDRDYVFFFEKIEQQQRFLHLLHQM